MLTTRASRSLLFRRENAIQKIGSTLLNVSCPQDRSLSSQSNQVFRPDSLTSRFASRNFGSSSSAPSRGNLKSFLLADVGEGISEVEIRQWFVKEGESIKEFDKVCEVESDKATLDISSRYEGTIVKLYYKTGDKAKVGLPLMDIQSGGLPIEVVAHHSPLSPPPPPPASIPVPSTPISSVVSPSESLSSLATFATPAVRRIAKEMTVDLSHVKGTGKQGRISKEDILNYIALRDQRSEAIQIPTQPEPSILTTTTPEIPTPQPEQTSQTSVDRREPLKGYQKAMIKTMTASLSVPHFGYCDEIEMDRLVDLRNEMRSLAEKKGVAKITYLPFIIKATSLALKEFPILNSSLSKEQTEIIYHARHNIGVAVDTPQGLIVPNIKNVQDLTIIDIAKELLRIQGLAQQGRLTPTDLSGGTFTLSNIGSIGGTYASPVLLPGEVGIGALGKISTIPRFNQAQQVIPVRIMRVSWSADHRTIDGATMANFSTLWKKYLEHPILMLSEMK